MWWCQDLHTSFGAQITEPLHAIQMEKKTFDFIKYSIVSLLSWTEQKNSLQQQKQITFGILLCAKITQEKNCRKMD
jgi:hypothetical protein